MALLSALRQWANRIQRDLIAVYFAARDPLVPLAIRLLAVAVAAYALSPIDLIPDFIPVFGYLDDLLIVPLGLMLVIQWLPPAVLAAARERAAAVLERPSSYAAAMCVVGLWLLAALAMAYWLMR